MRRQRKAGTLALLCSVLFVFSASAQDWPQWRGPNRDGAVRDFTAPESWPSELKQVWKTPVGGGYASPVVANGKAWIHSRKNDDEWVSCLDLETGKIRWTKSYSASFAKNQYATQMGKGPHATPLLHAGKLYTFGVTAILSCFDAETGELKWRKEFPAPNTAKLFCGTAASPLIDQGRLIVYAGDDISRAARWSRSIRARESSFGTGKAKVRAMLRRSSSNCRPLGTSSQ